MLKKPTWFHIARVKVILARLSKEPRPLKRLRRTRNRHCIKLNKIVINKKVSTPTSRINITLTNKKTG